MNVQQKPLFHSFIKKVTKILSSLDDRDAEEIIVKIFSATELIIFSLNAQFSVSFLHLLIFLSITVGRNSLSIVSSAHFVLFANKPRDFLIV